MAVDTRDPDEWEPRVQSVVGPLGAAARGLVRRFAIGGIIQTEDLVQETLVVMVRLRGRMARRAARIHSPEILRWSVTIANHVAGHIARQRRRRRAHFHEVPLPEPGTEGSQEPASRDPGPEGRALESERRDRVLEALRGLSPEQIETLALVYGDRLSIKEAAAATDISAAAAGKRLARAIAAVRRAIERHDL